MSMELFIHYTTLPEGKKLEDVVEELNQVLDDDGVVCGGDDYEKGGRIDLELEDETKNPKFAQMAIKAYLQRVNF
ncbi:MAG: hypothetical protein IKK95_03995 [Lachnospiraceae bacterium]|nr:hypothetical protein [Lachnospiraceae bacterium]